MDFWQIRSRGSDLLHCRCTKAWSSYNRRTFVAGTGTWHLATASRREDVWVFLCVCVLRVPFVGLSGNPRGKPLVFGLPYVHLGIMAHADCHHRFGLGKGKDDVGPRSHEHVLPSLPNHDILLSCHVMQVFDVIVSRGSISLPMDKLYPCISFKVLKAVFFQGSCRRIPMTKIPRHVGRWFIAVSIQLV